MNINIPPPVPKVSKETQTAPQQPNPEATQKADESQNLKADSSKMESLLKAPQPNSPKGEGTKNKQLGKAQQLAKELKAKEQLSGGQRKSGSLSGGQLKGGKPAGGTLKGSSGLVSGSQTGTKTAGGEISGQKAIGEQKALLKKGEPQKGENPKSLKSELLKAKLLKGKQIEGKQIGDKQLGNKQPTGEPLRSGQAKAELAKQALRKGEAQKGETPKGETPKGETLTNLPPQAKNPKDAPTQKEHHKQDPPPAIANALSNIANPMANVLGPSVKIELPPHLATLASQIEVAVKTGTVSLEVNEKLLPATSVTINRDPSGNILVTLSTASPIALAEINNHLAQLQEVLPKGVKLAVKKSSKREGSAKSEEEEREDK